MPGQWPELVEETREKKPLEKIPIGIDFNLRLTPGDSFAAPPVATCVKEWGLGGQLGTGVPVWSGGIWSTLLEQGDAPSDHRLKVFVPTVAGHTLGHIVVIEIRT
jgi:hypothetical protein